MTMLTGQRWIAVSHLRAAYEAIAKIPEENAGPDHGNLSRATEYIEAAVGSLGGALHSEDNRRGKQE
jgi:hypothetical protein